MTRQWLNKDNCMQLLCIYRTVYDLFNRNVEKHEKGWYLESKGQQKLYKIVGLKVK